MFTNWIAIFIVKITNDFMTFWSAFPAEIDIPSHFLIVNTFEVISPSHRKLFQALLIGVVNNRIRNRNIMINTM